MKPPRDPVLRAIWQVSQTDLTPLQKLALLALWRYLGGKKRQIGAALLADLLGVSVGTAKNIFSTLQRRGYLSSNGRFTPRHHRRAARGLTKKLQLPENPGGKGRSSGSDRQRSSASDLGRSSASDLGRSSGSDQDQGVGLTGRPTPLRGDALFGKTADRLRVPISDTPENETVTLSEVMGAPSTANGKAVASL